MADISGVIEHINNIYIHLHFEKNNTEYEHTNKNDERYMQHFEPGSSFEGSTLFESTITRPLASNDIDLDV